MANVGLAAVLRAVLFVGLWIAGSFGAPLDATSLTGLPSVMLHYAPNGNFDPEGTFLPGKAGFNMADIADPVHLKALRPNIRVLAWIGLCDGVSDKFLATVKPYLNDSRVFGFYLMDDPDPRSRLGLPPPCPPQNLRAESDWLHEHVRGTKTVIVLMNLSDARTPTYSNGYNPENSHVDLYGLSAYPCRTAFNGCDIDLIDRYVVASDLAGIPRSRLVPIYQTFGGGRWRDDWGGTYIMPSVDQEIEIIRRWRTLVPSPVFDMAYSWGTQQDDVSLHHDPRLMEMFEIYNHAGQQKP